MHSQSKLFSAVGAEMEVQAKTEQSKGESTIALTVENVERVGLFGRFRAGRSGVAATHNQQIAGPWLQIWGRIGANPKQLNRGQLNPGLQVMSLAEPISNSFSQLVLATA